LQATFSKLKIIKGITTQGRSNYGQWVTSYSVSYSIDGITWSTVQHENKTSLVSMLSLFVIYN